LIGEFLRGSLLQESKGEIRIKREKERKKDGFSLNFNGNEVYLPLSVVQGLINYIHTSEVDFSDSDISERCFGCNYFRHVVSIIDRREKVREALDILSEREQISQNELQEILGTSREECEEISRELMYFNLIEQREATGKEKWQMGKTPMQYKRLHITETGLKAHSMIKSGELMSIMDLMRGDIAKSL
jgi:predicted HTH transcriptional regulator